MNLKVNYKLTYYNVMVFVYVSLLSEYTVTFTGLDLETFW